SPIRPAKKAGKLEDFQLRQPRPSKAGLRVRASLSVCALVDELVTRYRIDRVPNRYRWGHTGCNLSKHDQSVLGQTVSATNWPRECHEIHVPAVSTENLDDVRIVQAGVGERVRARRQYHPWQGDRSTECQVIRVGLPMPCAN